MYLIDGSDIIHKYKTKEFLDFYLFTKNNFEIYLKNISKENIYPEKNSNCAVCDYSEVCENIWEKDNNDNAILKGAINSLAKRQIDKIKEWEQANPYWNKTEEGTNNYIKMVQSITECNDDKIDNKIIKTIAKEVIIDK